MKFLLLFLLTTNICFAYPQTPEPNRSPGTLCTLIDQDFKEFRYPEKIHYCKRNVSQSDRKRIYKNYGISWEDRENYTIDHIIPLSIGGTNADTNLWPEHLYLKCQRGNLEFNLYLQLRAGDITQKEAVKIILDSKFKR